LREEAVVTNHRETSLSSGTRSPHHLPTHARESQKKNIKGKRD
jgi:hypothetical protein